MFFFNILIYKKLLSFIAKSTYYIHIYRYVPDLNIFQLAYKAADKRRGQQGCTLKYTQILSLNISVIFLVIFKFISVSFYYLPPSVENEFETQIFTSLLIDIFSEEMSQESVYIRRRIILIYLILKTNLEFLIHKLTIMANKFYYRAS